MRIFNRKTKRKLNSLHVRYSVFRYLLLIFPAIFIMGIPFQAQGQGENFRDLTFGTFAPGASGGEVIISPAGHRSANGTVVLLENTSYNSASFGYRVGGKHKLRISLPLSAQLTREGGGGSMNITNFTSDWDDNRYETRPGSPQFYYVNVGATLNVKGATGNPGGNYRGTFTVTFHQE